MFNDGSTGGLQSLQDTHVYPIAITVILAATALALSMDRSWIGIAGIVVLSLLSLGYGAIQSPDETE